MVLSTRWYAFAKMLKSVEVYVEGIRKCKVLSDMGKLPALPSDVTNIILSDSFTLIPIYVKILSLLVESIAFLERKDANLGDIWPTFLKLFKFFKGLSTETFSVVKPMIEAGLKSLEKRVKSFDSKVYIVAFNLNPRYRY